MDDQQDQSSKRAALTGQWKTPPVPMFPTTPFPQHQHHQAQPQVQQQQAIPAPEDITAPSSIPESSEDYVKALQEAYRKGAQAAARMVQQQPPAPLQPQPLQPHPPHQQQPLQPHPQHQHQPLQQQQQQQTADGMIQTAASCPNFRRTTVLPAIASNTINGIQSEEAAYHAAAVPLTSPALSAATAPMMTSPAAIAAPQGVHFAPNTHSVPDPLQSTNMHMAMPQAPQMMVPGAAASKPAARSVSMPDMSSYTAQVEEEKRQKRLARNRASARLRRLRKKTLVDAYETEVGVLEKTLKQLRAHEWGADDDHKALLDALGMERGQQTVDPAQRAEVIRGILEQQLEQVDLLRQTQMEQQCLAMMIQNPDDEASKELQQILNLTDTQKQEILNASRGLDKEVEALETIAASLRALQDNDWLVNEGVQEITDQFTTILHKNQMSKFLLWTDSNVEAIDQLDFVQVQPLQPAPIFTFGAEANPMDDEEK